MEVRSGRNTDVLAGETASVGSAQTGVSVGSRLRKICPLTRRSREGPWGGEAESRLRGSLDLQWGSDLFFYLAFWWHSSGDSDWVSIQGRIWQIPHVGKVRVQVFDS